MSSSDESDFDLELAAEKALQSLLPAKSKEKYEKAYSTFKEWCKNKKIMVVDENAILVYFSVELEAYQSSTAWSIYSMLKATLKLKDNVDISGYNNLRALLKRKSDGYRPKKSEVFKIGEVYQFLKEAPDNIYLAVKVALIVGIFGACRRVELCDLTVDQIGYIDGGIKIVVPKTKTNTIREFVIDEGGDPELNCVAMFKRYANLRPSKTHLKRFFMCYRNGKCINQPIGINTIGGYPKIIATFLNLENVKLYTGHCFRRTSSSLLADSGVNISILKRHGGWRSDSVAEGYVVSSLNNKRSIASKIMGHNIENQPETGNHEGATKIQRLTEPSSLDMSNSGPSASVGHTNSSVGVPKVTGERNVTIISTERCESRVDVIEKKTMVNPTESAFALFRDLQNCNFYIYQK